MANTEDMRSQGSDDDEPQDIVGDSDDGSDS